MITFDVLGEPGAALWVRLLLPQTPQAPQEIWIWRPVYPPIQGDATQARALKRAGWTPLGPSGDVESLLVVLRGQMADVLEFVSLPRTTTQWLARQEDLDRVRAAPVLLAFGELPLARAYLRAHPEDSAVPVATELPPPAFGEYAVVLGADLRTVYVYPLDALATRAAAVQRELQRDLHALVVPADWWVLTDALRLCCHSEAAYLDQHAHLLAAAAGAIDEQERQRYQQELHDLQQANGQAEALRAAQRRGATGESSDKAARLARLRQNVAILAQLYWEHHQAQQSHAAGLLAPLAADQQLGVRSQAGTALAAEAATLPRPARPLPRIPHVFAQQIALPFPETSLPVEAVLAAYSNAQSGATGWSDTQGVPQFAYERTDAGTAIIQLRPDTGSLQTKDVIEALWKQVRKFSEMDGDVFLCALLQWLAASSGQREADGYDVWITAAQILDYRSRQPIMKRDPDARSSDGRRRAGHRNEDLARVAQTFAHMRNTWITLRREVEEVRLTGNRKRRVSRIRTQASALIQIAEVILQREVISADDAQHPDHVAKALLEESAGTTSSLPVAWRYRMGTWLDPFVMAPNRQIARLVERTLKYDPMREYWEKRLARYVLFRLRLTSGGAAAALSSPVGTLLQELNISIAERHPERTRTHLESALTRLREEGHIAYWEYEDDRPALPAHHWLPVWLSEWRVRIAVPAIETLADDSAVVDAYPALATRAATLDALRDVFPPTDG